MHTFSKHHIHISEKFHVSFVYVFSVPTAVTNIFSVIFVVLIYEGHCFLGCGDKV